MRLLKESAWEAWGGGGGGGGDTCVHNYINPCQRSYCYVTIITSNKNIHFEMILDVGIGEKRKETRFLI